MGKIQNMVDVKVSRNSKIFLLTFYGTTRWFKDPEHCVRKYGAPKIFLQLIALSFPKKQLKLRMFYTFDKGQVAAPLKNFQVLIFWFQSSITAL